MPLNRQHTHTHTHTQFYYSILHDSLDLNSTDESFMCNGPRTICNAAYSLPIHCLCTAHFLPIHAHPLTGTEPWNNSALWRVMGRVLTASAGPLVVLYSSSIPLFILYSSSILLYSPLFILYSSSIHPLFSSIHPLFILYSPLFILYSSSILLYSPLFILYSSSIHPRLSLDWASLSLSVHPRLIFDFLVTSSTRLSIMHFRHAPLHPSVHPSSSSIHPSAILVPIHPVFL
jgi:hypothetical protein